MNPFHRVSLELTTRDAAFVALAAGITPLAYRLPLHTALQFAGILALLFAIIETMRAMRLDDSRITRTEVWLALPPSQRPAGSAGLKMARETLQLTQLRFAQAAAGAAAFFFFADLVSFAG